MQSMIPALTQRQRYWLEHIQWLWLAPGKMLIARVSIQYSAPPVWIGGGSVR